MKEVRELQHAVESAFAETSQGLASWAPPHPDRAPLDAEYSRVSDVEKWRIIPARADAWCLALFRLGLASVECGVTQSWVPQGRQLDLRVDRLLPDKAGALPLVVGYWRFIGAEANVDLNAEPNAVTIGAGDPAIVLTMVPDCGCDACDSGSESFLNVIDDHIRGVVTGEVRQLTKGARTITVHNREQWAATGSFARGEIEQILIRPEGWSEVSGPSWFAAIP